MDTESEGEERRRRREGWLSITGGVDSERERERPGKRRKSGENRTCERQWNGRMIDMSEEDDGRKCWSGKNGEKKCQSIDQYGQKGGEKISEIGKMRSA